MADSEIKKTTDYDRFKFLETNRRIDESHVRAIGRSLAVKPESLKYRPILVNENMEVIEGQHRLAAAKMLGIPVYYQQGEGLGIADTQRFNANQRNWAPMDYARSYAQSGKAVYDEYLHFKETYKWPHKTTMSIMTGSQTKGNREFMRGEFKIRGSRAEITDRFEKVAAILDRSPEESRVTQLQLAALSLISHPDYDHELFLRKMELYAAKHLRRFVHVPEYQRALEAIYNERTAFEEQIRVF